MAKKAKKMTPAVKAKLAAYKKAKKKGGGAKKSAARKAPAKGLVKARSRSSSVVHAADGFQLKKPPKGASDAVRLSALESNQAMIMHGLTAVASEVVDHRHALVGQGLLKGYGTRSKR